MKKIEEMSLEEKIGQLFIVGLLNGKETEKIKVMIEKYKIGGVVIYKRNYNSYPEMVKLVNEIKRINRKNDIPIFISIDQEGGRVNRMPDEVSKIKSATEMANTKDMEMVKQSGALIGKMLKQTGISMNYAPTLDIRRFGEQQAIGDRSYGKNKEEVSKYGIEVMKQIQENGVVSVIKHFPGHGSTAKDSHFTIPTLTKKIGHLEKDDMEPFENAIKQGADAIMVGHLMVKGGDFVYPASLSKKIISKYLIEKYNYKGLIITDDLKMMAIRAYYNINRAVVRAIKAGNDMVMLGNPYKEIEDAIKYMTKKAKAGKLSEERIDESVQKILNMKEKYKVNDNQVKGFNIEEMNREIDELNENIKKLTC